MRSVAVRLVFLPISVFFIAAVFASAQDLGGIEQGIKPYGSYHGGDIDSVSMVNGSLQGRIPLVSLPQRGGRLKYNVVLLYQNPYYTYTDSCNSDPNPTCIPSWYTYHLTYGGSYNLAHQSPGVPFGLISDFMPRSLGYHFNAQGTVLGLELREFDGAMHLIGGGVSQDATGYSGTFNSTMGTYGTEIILDKNGTSYYFPYVSLGPGHNPATAPGAPNKVEDVNGNLITENPTTFVWTDTFGRLLGGNSSSTTDYSGCTGTLPTVSASIASYPAPNGGTTQFKFCNAQFPVSYTPPGCTGTCHGINTTVTTFQSVVLSNGTSWATSPAWTFALDGYGAMSKVVYPTGGSISYTSVIGSPGGECFTQGDGWKTNYAAMTTSRTVDANDGTGPHAWAYNYGSWDMGAPFQTVVTDPTLN